MCATIGIIMFSINSYLQYKNTPDGKPRLLREGVDYGTKSIEFLHKWDGSEDLIIARLDNCRPLLLVEIDGGKWNEGDVVSNPFTHFISFTYTEQEIGIPRTYDMYLPSGDNLGSFFDDPAKYSKLLWDCSEKEGWEKVLNLLKL